MIRPPDPAFQTEESGSLTGDLTSMLDVLFILLIFFVLTANSVQLALDVSLPRQDPRKVASLKPQEKVVIAIPRDSDKWVIAGKPYDTLEAAEEVLRQIRSDQPKSRFIVAPDRAINVERLLKMLTLLQRLGIKNTELLMEPK